MRGLVGILLIVALAPLSASGQSQVPPCPAPILLSDVGDLKQRLLTLAERGTLTSWGVVNHILHSVYPTPPCARMAATQDVDSLLREMIRFAFGTNTVDPWTIAFGTSSAVQIVVRGMDGRPARSLPLDEVVAAIEGGVSVGARSWALAMLLELADLPGVESYLLEKARSPGGPNELPDVPVQLVRMMYAGTGNAPMDGLLSRLEAEPGLIQSDRVRCWAERGGIPDPHVLPEVGGCP